MTQAKYRYRQIGTRVLTRVECLSLLEEKEQKKRKEAEEKETRKLEREVKRGKEKKTTSRRQMKEHTKMLEKAQGDREKVEKAQTKLVSKKVKAKQAAQPKENNPRRKRPRLGDMDESIDLNCCCACISSFEDDTARHWKRMATVHMWPVAT